MTNTTDKYLKITKVMEILDCKERHIYDLIAAGEILAIRIGSQARRISEKSLNDYIERNKINPEDLFDPDVEKTEVKADRPVARSRFIAQK